LDAKVDILNVIKHIQESENKVSVCTDHEDYPAKGPPSQWHLLWCSRKRRFRLVFLYNPQVDLSYYN